MAHRKEHTLIDLFAGSGGLSLGFSQANYQVLLGIDNWECSLQTFRLNHAGSEVLSLDLSQPDMNAIVSHRLDPIDVIVGGPPCQGFSIAGKRLIEDPRNRLYKSFVQVVKTLQPKAFLMESVPNLASMNKGRIKDQIINDFENVGYTVASSILIASEYGVPQDRKRLFFVGLKNGQRFIFPKPTHGMGSNLIRPITAREAIGDLPEDELMDGAPYPESPKSEYQSLMRRNAKGIYNHQITRHTERTKSIIQLVPDGGNYKDLPKRLWNTRKVNIAWTRMNSKKPSFTIDTGHNHHFHYSYNRVPTARESARLQSFPDNFIFSGKKNEQLVQIGNAVPPILARVIANQLKKHL